MIHLKSTLAISGLMLAGLVAASPFPYPSDFEPRQPRRTASVQTAPAVETASAPAAVTAWADPPAKAPTEAPVQTAAAALPAPAAEPVTILAPGAAAVPVRHASLQAPSQAKAEQARRRKVARASRDRQMMARQAAPAGESQVASQATQPSSQRIDPIGDILRGLGIGREG